MIAALIISVAPRTKAAAHSLCRPHLQLPTHTSLQHLARGMVTHPRRPAAKGLKCLVIASVAGLHLFAARIPQEPGLLLVAPL